MTDNEIIKALECCPKAEMSVDCKKLGCPMLQKRGCAYVVHSDLDGDTDVVLEGLTTDALNLIKKQQAEIKRLNGVIKNFKATKERQKAEIEKLKRVIYHLERVNESLPDMIKAEAVKYFAERLCKDRVSNDPVVIAVKVELKTAGVDNG